MTDNDYYYNMAHLHAIECESMLKDLTRDQRMEIFEIITGEYCKNCGSDNVYCRCEDDS